MDEIIGSSSVILCVFVFLSRILDVSFGTMRMVSVVRGKSLLAMGMGFCETFIWFLCAREALQSASGVLVAVFYASGHATGTLLGTLISKLVTKGKIELHVVTSGHDKAVIDALRAAGFGISAVEISASNDGKNKFLLVTSMDSRKQHEFCTLLKKLDPDAFIAISDMRTTYNGHFAGK